MAEASVRRALNGTKTDLPSLELLVSHLAAACMRGELQLLNGRQITSGEELALVQA